MYSKKGKRSKIFEKYLITMIEFYHHFPFWKKKSGDCCRCRRLSFPKTVHCCVSGLQIWPLYLSGCHMSSVFVWPMSWSMIIRLGGRERRLFWRVGGFNLGALRLLLGLLQQRSVYWSAKQKAMNAVNMLLLFFASCATFRCIRSIRF